MPLQKQNVSISFAEGLDTKTDPRQVVPGKLEVLQNSKFTAGMELQKRNGNTQLATTGSGVGNSVASYDNELLSFDKYNLYSYVSEFPENLNKGFSQPIDVTSDYIYAPKQGVQGPETGFYPMDSCTHSAGYTLYAYNGRYYVITSRSGGQVVLAEQDVSTHATAIKSFALGNYFIVVYYDSSTSRLNYIAIPISTLVPAAPVLFIPNTNGIFDGVVQGTSLFLATDDTGTNIKIRSLDPSLTLSSIVTLAAGGGVTTTSVWYDAVPATPTIWVGFYNGTKVRYLIVNSNNLSTFLAATDIVTIANINAIIGYQIGSAGHLSAVYYEQKSTYSYSSVQNNLLYCSTANDTGTVGSSAIIQRGVSPLSRVFQMNGSPDYNYFVLTYGPANGANLEPTYFVMSHHVYDSGSVLNSAHNTPNIVAKLAAGSALPYAESTFAQYAVTAVTAVTSTTAQFAIAKASIVSTQSGTVYSQYAVTDILLDFNEGDAYQFQTLGNVSQYTGGFLWMYDSNAPVEQNFHLFPEDMVATYDSTAGGITKNPGGTPYQYIAIYRWQDSQGNTHKSAPSVALSIDISGSGTNTNTITVNVPTLRLTEKPTSSSGNIPHIGPVFIDLYRNTPTAPGGNAIDIFYKVTGSLVANSNNTSVDSLAIADTLADSAIVGNELLYTTGGVSENSGGPPSAGITVFKSRLFVIDAEDRNVLWFSKQTLETTPVEMVQNFTLFVDPRFGPMTAIAVMDDKLIVFKENAIFYITGDGPDSTGANNDFSDATFIASNAGCVDPRSIVVTQDGLMFKSNKGIYLLDRGLGVTYIGAPVESFNSSNITGAELIPVSTQVQFALNDGTSCLMYDYFYKQWSVYTNYNAVGATVYNDQFTYIDPTGHIFTESPGVFSDNGTAIYQSLTTSWLSLSGLQGYQRIYRLYLLYKYLSANSINVSIMYDFNTAIAQTITLDATAQNALNGTDVGQWRINIDKQKCQAIRLTITETADSNNTIGAGINIEAIGALVGSKLSYPKLPAVQAATS